MKHFLSNYTKKSNAFFQAIGNISFKLKTQKAFLKQRNLRADISPPDYVVCQTT